MLAQFVQEVSIHFRRGYKCASRRAARRRRDSYILERRPGGLRSCRQIRLAAQQYLEESVRDRVF